MLYLLSNRVAK